MVMHSTSRGKQFFSSFLRSIFISSALVVLSLFTSQGVAYAAPCTDVTGNSTQVNATTILVAANYYDDNFDPCEGFVVVDWNTLAEPTPVGGLNPSLPFQFPDNTYTQNFTGAILGETYYFRFRLFAEGADINVDSPIVTDFADVTMVGSPDPDPDPDPVDNTEYIPSVTTSVTQDPGEWNGDYLAMAVGSDGFTRFAHLDYAGGDNTVRFERCLDAECTTRSTVALAVLTGDIGNIAMELINDIPHVVYLESTGGVGANNRNVVLHRCDDEECTTFDTSTITTAYNGAAKGGSRVATAIGSDDFLRMVYPDGTTDYPTFLRCTNATCTTYNEEELESVSGATLFPSMVVDRSDIPRIVYHDYTNDRVRYVACSDTDCITTTLTTIESVGAHDAYDAGTAIALSQSDNAYLAWRRFSDGSTRFAQCVNAACSSRNTITLDSEDSGYWIDMEVAGNGLPTVVHNRYLYGGSYPLGYVGIMRYVQCLNATCQFRQTTDTAENDEDNGLFIRSGVRPDGRINIVYMNSTDYSEAYVLHTRCGNYSCDDSTPPTHGSAVGDPVPYSTVLGVPGNGAGLWGLMDVVENTLGYGTVVYADSDASEIVVVYCTSQSCHDPIRTVIANVGVNGVRIVQGSDDLPKIVYDDGGELKLVACTNESCTSSTTYTVDSALTGYYVKDVAQDDSDIVHILYQNLNSNGDLHYGYCANATCSGFTDTVLWSEFGGLNDATMTLGTDNRMRIVYSHLNTGEVSYVRCTALDCSTSVTEVIIENTPFNAIYATDIIVASDGFARVVYSAYIDDGWAYAGVPHMYLLTCTNLDCTTTETITIDDNYYSGEWARMELNAAGFPIIVYHSYIEQYGLRIAECRNLSCTSMDRSILVHGLDLFSGDGHNWEFAIAVGATAVHVVSEHNFSGPTRTQLEYFYYPQTTRTYPLTSFIDEWAGAVGKGRGKAAGPTITLGSDGFPRIVQIDRWMGSILFHRCFNIECTWKHWQTVRQDDSSLEMTSLVLTNSDLPRIAYRDYSNNLRLIRCSDELCVSRTDSLLADMVDVVVNFQMVVDPVTDIPYALFHTQNLNDGEVYFLACNNSACTAPTITFIADTYLWSELQPGVALGPDDLPRFVYSDVDGDFHFVQCTNADCTTREDTVVYTSPSPDDFYTESVIRFGADGFARVAVLDSDVNYEGYTRYIQCTNATCSSNVIVNITDPIEYSWAGWDIGMDLGPNDAPFFSLQYWDVVSGDPGLLFVSCSDTACSSTSERVLRDPNAVQAIGELSYQKYVGLTQYTDAIADVDGNPLILHTNILRSGDTYKVGSPTDANNQYLELILCNNPQCTTNAVFTGTVGEFNIAGATVSNNVAGASNVDYVFTLDEVEGVDSDYIIVLTFPPSYSDAFTTLVPGDVTVSGPGIDSGATVVEIDPLTNTITITLVTTGPLAADAEIEISIAGIDNPQNGGIYNIGIEMYDDEDELIAQGYSLFNLQGAVDVRAVVTEALILTLSNLGVTLQVDPALNDGQDITQQTTLDVASNAIGGYVLYAQLDDGTGAAGLRSLLGDVISSTLVEGDNYIGYTGRNDGVGESVSAEHTFTNAPSPLYDSGGAALGFTQTTDGQPHTINYDVNVNFLTPAGIYVGTVFYTVVPRF